MDANEWPAPLYSCFLTAQRNRPTEETGLIAIETDKLRGLLLIISRDTLSRWVQALRAKTSSTLRASSGRRSPGSPNVRGRAGEWRGRKSCVVVHWNRPIGRVVAMVAPKEEWSWKRVCLVLPGSVKRGRK